MSTVHECVWNGDVEAVRYQLSQGTDPDLRNEDGLTMLQIASTIGWSDIVKMLLSSGADVQLGGPAGWCARDYAMCNGNAQVLSLLESTVTDNVSSSTTAHGIILHSECSSYDEICDLVVR